MQLDFKGLLIGAGLVILYKKNPDILSNIVTPIKSLLSGNGNFSNTLNEDNEMSSNDTGPSTKNTNNS